jgi:hypothetical protein
MTLSKTLSSHRSILQRSERRLLTRPTNLLSRVVSYQDHFTTNMNDPYIHKSANLLIYSYIYIYIYSYSYICILLY